MSYPSSSSLRELVRSSDKHLVNNVLCSTIVFPRTTSAESPLDITGGSRCAKSMVCVTQDSLDLQAVLETVRNDPHIAALGLCHREDVDLVLRLLIDVQEELILNKFDGVAIGCSGIDLVCIELTNNRCGRSAYVDDNDYRRRLQQRRAAFYDILSSSAVPSSLLCEDALLSIAFCLGFGFGFGFFGLK